MIIETRESLLHSFERRSRRRHHTLDNATLDQFNFICVPLNLDEAPNNSSSSHSNLTITSSNDFLNLKPIRLSSPTRRVRFKLDEDDKNRDNDEHIHSSDIVQFPKDYSIHRVEFQIPMHTDINSWLNIECPSPFSTLAKTRSLTSQKIDINYNNNNNNATYQQNITPSINSPILSTIDCNKTQTQWYKDMYCQIHKLPENKKDVLLIKLPPTPSRYQEYYQNQDEQQNPYKPTYTFPEEFNDNLERMEDYMRKAASQNIDDDYRHISSSPVRTSTTTVKDHKIIPKRDTEKKLTRFDDQLSSPTMTGSSIERAKSVNDASPSSIMINSKPNTNYRTSSSMIDDEQKLIYKRILRGGDIPSVGLQKLSINNREKSNDRSNESYERQDDDFLELNRQKLQSRINDSQPIYKAFALHNFYPETNRELPFKKGDTIFVKRRINDDWLEGEHQGLTGIFPLNHVELFPYEIIEQENPNEKEQQIEGEAIVKYDFIPEKSYELQLKKGDKVILLQKFDNNWYEGRLNHVEGIFPADYVETIREPKSKSLKQSNQNEHTTNTIKMPKSALKNSTRLQQTATEKINILPELSIPMQKCQVLYDYTPQNSDELEIHVGDIINIVEMCDDGWYCGIIEKSNHGNIMEFGTFPGNYIKLLPV